MSDETLFVVGSVTAIGCGLMAGLFFAFSVAVMPGFRRIAPSSGLSAMQAINLVIVNPIFLLVFLGTAVTAAALVISAVWRGVDLVTAHFVFGGTLYLVGVILVTAVVNVPMNNAIAPLDALAPESARRWQDYQKRWTAWNHVRTVAALFATAVLIFGLSALHH
jgi:uncharacterized membrane protein